MTWFLYELKSKLITSTKSHNKSNWRKKYTEATTKTKVKKNPNFLFEGSSISENCMLITLCFYVYTKVDLGVCTVPMVQCFLTNLKMTFLWYPLDFLALEQLIH